MCLLIYKPAGNKLPSYNDLKAAADCNPDGFGFATPKTYFRSLNFDVFYTHLLNVKDSEPCIIHLRWATHGSVKISNCHPFKKGHVVFAHNGVLSIEPLKDKTDSETAFITRIYPTVQRYGLYSREVSQVVNSIIGGSKFAIMTTNGETKLFGNFTRLEDGNFYSNTRHLYRRMIRNVI